jgi:hypothetical protein
MKYSSIVFIFLLCYYFSFKLVLFGFSIYEILLNYMNDDKFNIFTETKKLLVIILASILLIKGYIETINIIIYTIFLYGIQNIKKIQNIITLLKLGYTNINEINKISESNKNMLVKYPNILNNITDFNEKKNKFIKYYNYVENRKNSYKLELIELWAIFKTHDFYIPIKTTLIFCWTTSYKLYIFIDFYINSFFNFIIKNKYHYTYYDKCIQFIPSYILNMYNAWIEYNLMRKEHKIPNLEHLNSTIFFNSMINNTNIFKHFQQNKELLSVIQNNKFNTFNKEIDNLDNLDNFLINNSKNKLKIS